MAVKHAVLLLGASGLLGAVLASAITERPAWLRPRGGFEWWVILGMVAATVSTLTGVSPIRSLLGEPEQREGLLTILALGTLALASARSHTATAHRERTLTVFVGAALAAAAYAMLQQAGLDPIHWENPTLYPTGSGHVVRPTATLGSAILLGVVLVPALVITAGRSLARPDRAWFLVPITILLAAAMLATLSRGAWLGAGIGLALALAVALAGSWARTSAMARVLALTTLPTLAWATAVLRAPIVARLAEGGDPNATSGPARAAIAQAAFRILRAHPWWGSGPDTFGLLFPNFQPAEYVRHAWLGNPGHAHSSVLQTLATLGIFGALCGGGVLLAGARTSLRHSRGDWSRWIVTAACLGLIVVAGVDSLGLGGATSLAIFAGLATSRDTRGEEALHPARIPPIALAGCLAAMLTCSGLVTVQLRASACAGVVRARLEQGVADPAGSDSGPGTSAAQSAVALSPYDDAYARLASDFHAATARRRESSGDRSGAHLGASAALATAQRAVEVEPLRAIAHERLGVAEAMLATWTTDDSLARAHRDAARLSFSTARRLAPHDPLILVSSCRAALTLREGDWALAQAESLRALSPTSATAWALRAGALLTLGRTTEARSALDSASTASWEPGSARERAMVELARRTLGLGTASRRAQGSPGSDDGNSTR